MSSTANSTAEDAGRTPGEIEFPSLDGTLLRGRYWARPRPRGVLIISHGLGEHGGSYRRTAEYLTRALEIDILTFDYRGSGRSSGKRGYVRSYEEFSKDLEASCLRVSAERPGLPKFLLGHSNGGVVVLRTLLDRDLGLSGVIVSNPSLRLLARVPVWKRLAAEFLRRFAPTITLTTGLTNDQLTRDPEIVAEIEADALRHDRISPPLYFGMKAAGPVILARAGAFRTPILMIVGGADPIADPKSCRLFFDSLGVMDKTLRVYPSMRHEPLNEVGRESVLSDLATWLEPRLIPRA